MGEVGGAADQFRQVGAKGIQCVVGVLASGQTLVFWAEARQLGIPILGQFAAQHALE